MCTIGIRQMCGKVSINNEIDNILYPDVYIYIYIRKVNICLTLPSYSTTQRLSYEEPKVKTKGG